MCSISVPFHYIYVFNLFCFRSPFPRGFPGGSEGKASACNSGDSGSIPGSGRSPEKEMATYSSVLAWNGWRSLVGYSPQGRKESDKIE